MHASGNLFIAAIDFWSPSINALEMAARFAGQFNGKVLAIHVLEKSFHYPASLAIDVDTIMEDLDRAMQNLILPFQGRGVAIDYELRRGDVTRQLVEALHDHQADAVFVGIREGRVLEDIFIGTHTLHLVKSGEVPVVVVESAPNEADVKEILIPLDRRIGVDGVLKFIAALDHPIASSALVITALKPNESEEEVKATANDLADQLKKLGIHQITIEIVKDEDAYGAIMDQIRADTGIFDLVLLEHPDLVSLGEFTLGSLVEEVVTKGGTPVVCLPVH